MRILLRDYATRTGRYELEPITGEMSFSSCGSHLDSQKNSRGFGVVKSTGLLSKTSTFFALYTLDQRLLLYAGKEVFDLNNTSIQVKRRSLFPFVKRFDIYSHKRLRHSWLYWYSDLMEDGFDIHDFLLYVVRKAGSERERAVFVYFWEEVSKGRDPKEQSFQEELQRL